MTIPDGVPFDALDLPSGGSAIAPHLIAESPPPRRLPCGVRLRDAVLALAAARGTDAGALALAAQLLLPDGADDPGESDTEGAAVLVLRASVGGDDAALRRALAAAVALADPGFRVIPAGDVGRLEAAVETLGYRNKTLAHALKRLSFQPLEGQITEVRDAALMFGFLSEWCFDEDLVRRRFRELAPVYHPDTGVVACRERMAQLIDARNILIHHVRTVYASGAWVARRAL
ncbi:J domain-containing protein [Azospirillum cavernae]|uniref:J domain-containing protein n=1 Tax=Azospirillum cavernae TaxID=2320860 RepID=A0A418W3T9_9PROT|nr:J domain-containing protein [Azospirillum cavernae]RJF84693.1 J domain-containing protein [Azospirillum cavernae]